VEYWVKSDPFNLVTAIGGFPNAGRFPIAFFAATLSSGPDLRFFIDFYQPRNNQNYNLPSTVVVHLSGQGDNIFQTYYAPLCNDSACFSNVSSTCVGCLGVFRAADRLRPTLDACGVCGGDNSTCTVCYC
jgi:hypothetical protein